MRANKATSAWGLEVRVPFLDKAFINTAMSIDPEWKMVSPPPPAFVFHLVLHLSTFPGSFRDLFFNSC